MGSDPARLVRAAVAALGGMERFVKRGETVLVKPNMAWDRTPEQGANTHPEVVAEVVRLCRAAGARRVIVTDNPVHDAERVAARSGIRAAVAAAGGELVLPGASGFERTTLGGSVLASWDVLSVLFQADRLVNVPVAKHHSLSRLTCGLKNHMGLIGGSRGRLHQEIHPSLVDLAAAFRPTLTVVDATRVMMRNGPTGGRLEDVAAVNAVAAGTDPVACDAWAARQIGLDPARGRPRRPGRRPRPREPRGGSRRGGGGRGEWLGRCRSRRRPRSPDPGRPSTCRASFAACTRASSSSSSSPRSR